MANYCSTTDITADMPDAPLYSSTDDAYSYAIGTAIVAASRLIDRYVGRWDNYFYPSTDAETRYYDGEGNKQQYIDECMSITSVAVAEDSNLSTYTSWTDGTDYLTFPYNQLPTFELIIHPDGGKFRFPLYRKAIRVVGIFGGSLTPPEEVKRACKIQAMRYFMRAKQSYQDTGVSPELGQLLYTQELDPDVKLLLRRYAIGCMV